MCDGVSAGGGCEAVCTRTRCRWAKLMECGEILCIKRCPLELNLAFTRAIQCQQLCM